MARPPIQTLTDDSAAKLGIVDDPAMSTAVRLAATAHAHRDAGTWGGLSYWDQLCSRMLLATYRADTLPGWWEQMARSMGCSLPTKSEDRDLLASLFAEPAGPVLEIIATQTEAVALRVRLAWEHHFGPRATNARPNPTTTEQEALL